MENPLKCGNVGQMNFIVPCIIPILFPSASYSKLLPCPSKANQGQKRVRNFLLKKHEFPCIPEKNRAPFKRGHESRFILRHVCLHAESKNHGQFLAFARKATAK